MSDLYATVSDTLAEVIGKAKGQSTGFFYDLDHLTLDQQIRVLQVQALLAVAEEISALNPRNVQYRDDADQVRNGWGKKTHRSDFDLD